MAKITATKEEIVAAFAKWEQDNRAEPDAYMSDAEISGISPEEYGEQAASFFIKTLTELRG